MVFSVFCARPGGVSHSALQEEFLSPAQCCDSGQVLQSQAVGGFALHLQTTGQDWLDNFIHT